MDKSAYDVYLRYYDGDKQKIRNLILAFVNGMQAIYHYPQVNPIEIPLERELLTCPT